MLCKSYGWLKDKHFVALQELLVQERWEKGVCVCVCMLNFKIGSKAYKKDN